MAWTLFVNGSATLERGDASLLLKGPNQQVHEQVLRFEFKISNNEAEYEALLSRLWLTRELQVQDLTVFSDLQLVVSQVERSYEAQDAIIAKYLAKMQRLTHNFSQFNVF